MRKLLLSIGGALLALLASTSAYGQCSTYTQVTGKITDPSGVPYAFGSVTADLFPSGGTPTCNPASGTTRAQFSTHIGPTALDATGSFTMQLPPGSIIQPGGTQWTFTVAQAPGVFAPFGVGPVQFTYTVTITGATQNLTTALTALAPNLTIPFCNPLQLVAGCGGAGGGQTFLTVNNETATLPNSRRELPGTNIAFDDTVSGQRTVNVPTGAGGATSVGLTEPPEFAVAGSPVTTTGTLAVTKTPQQPLTVWAGPLSSASANIVGEAKGICDGCSPATATLNVTPGDLLIVIRSAKTATNPSSSAGDTFIQATGNNADVDTYLFYTCSAVGGPTTISQVTGAGYSAQIHVFDVSGAAPSACLDPVGSAGWDISSGMGYTNSLSATTSGGVSQPSEIVFGAFSSAQSTCISMSPGSDFTQLEQTISTSGVEGNWPFMSEVLNTQSGLSGTQTANASCHAQSWNGLVASFKLNTVLSTAPPSFKNLADLLAAAKVTAPFSGTVVAPVTVTSTPTTIASQTITAPATGCPCRAFLSYSLYLDYGSYTNSAATAIWISDGTSTIAGTQTGVSNARDGGKTLANLAQLSPTTYANSQPITFTLVGQNTDSSVDVLGAPTVGAGPNSYFQVSFQSALGGGGGGGGGSAMGTQYQMGYFNVSGNVVSGFPSTVPATKGIFDCGYTLPTDAIVIPSCPQTGLGGSAITGAAGTYTVASTDNLQVVNHDVAGSAAVTVTLPTPTTLENASFGFSYENDSAQMDVITPTAWTINGAASIPVPPNASVRIKVDSFNTNNWLAVYSGSPSRVVNGIAYSAFYPGATLDVRVNACVTDAETGAHGATSHICSSVGEPASLQTSGVGIVNQITVGDSGNDPVTWVTPASCSWYVFLTGGTKDAIFQYSKSRITSYSEQRAGCSIENDSVNSGPLYLYQNQGAGYYQLDGMTFADRIGGTLAGGAVMDIVGAYDNSSYSNFGVANYIAGTKGIVLGNSTPCCAMNLTNGWVYGNNTGGTEIYINTGSGGTQQIGFNNMSIGHSAEGTPLVSYTDTGNPTFSQMTWTDVYEEVTNTGSNTTTVPNQLNQLSSLTVHGLKIHNLGGTLMTAAIFSIAAATHTNPTSLHIDGLTAQFGWTKSIVAVVNNNYAGALANVAYTGANGTLVSYDSNTDYHDNVVAATVNAASFLQNGSPLTIGLPAAQNITAVTVNANSTSPQLLQEIALNAGLLNSLNQTYIFNAAGVYTDGAAQTPTLTFTVQLCTVSGCGSGTVVSLMTATTGATTTASGDPWRIEWTFGDGRNRREWAGLGERKFHCGPWCRRVYQSNSLSISARTSSAIDLTAALYLDVTVTTSTGSTGNTITQNMSILAPQSNPANSGTIASGSYFVTGPSQNGSNASGFTANRDREVGFYLPYQITFSKISYVTVTADNTANLYDLGVRNSLGQLICNEGPTAGTTFAPAGNTLYTLNCLQGTITAPSGQYYIAMTAVTATATLGGSLLGQTPVNSTATVTSGATLAGSITPPSVSWTATAVPGISMHN